MNATVRVISWLAVLTSLTPAALAQVGPIQPGNILDANIGTASGGSNAPAVPESRLLDSQLYVNGQTTGLGNFHGRVGYFPSDQLRLRLPSANLSDFQRQSVGLAGVLSGQTLAPVAYLNRSSTVLGASSIAAGLNAPGTNMPRTSLALPQARLLYGELTTAYKSVLTVPLQIPPLVPAAQPGLAKPTGAAGDQLPADPFRFRRGGTQPDLVQELQEFQRLQGPLDERIDTRLETLLAPPAGGAANERPPVRPDGSPLPPLPAGGSADQAEAARGGRGKGAGDGGQKSLSGDKRPGEKRIGETGPAHPRQAPALGPNQDAFLDMMEALRRQRQGPLSVAPGGASAGGTAASAAGTPAAGTAATQPALRIVEPGPGGVIIHSLAGQDRGLFNYYMNRAQEKVKAGRFYDAAEDLHMAVLADSRNPMARLGLCLALLGAGESIPAGRHLRAALELFPPLMETRIDLLRFLDDQTLQQRLGELDGLVRQDQDNNRPHLALLAAYLHQSLGHEVLAKSAAKRLQDSAAGDKLLAAYAEYLLTGKRPG